MTEDASGNESDEKLFKKLMRLIDKEDVARITDSQRVMLMRFEKTNEMLGNCNALAMSRFDVSSKVLRKYTQQLADMKKDLDSVYRRIRFLKMRLSQAYPEAFQSCNNEINVVVEEEEEASDKTKNSTSDLPQ